MIDMKPIIDNATVMSISISVSSKSQSVVYQAEESNQIVNEDQNAVTEGANQMVDFD